VLPLSVYGHLILKKRCPQLYSRFCESKYSNAAHNRGLFLSNTAHNNGLVEMSARDRALANTANANSGEESDSLAAEARRLAARDVARARATEAMERQRAETAQAPTRQLNGAVELGAATADGQSSLPPGIVQAKVVTAEKPLKKKQEADVRVSAAIAEKAGSKF
jgi:hypothetical protein